MEIEYRKSKTRSYSKPIGLINTGFSQKQIQLQRLHYFFERQCDANPNSLALICDGKYLSYAELDTQANKLANYFAFNGIGVGNRVGILLERSINTYVTLLAILKCGAAFVPLDPSFPEDRVAFIAEDASFNLLVTAAKFKGAIAQLRTPILTLDSISAAIAQQLATRIIIPDHTDELCYIIYTSGTTGRPKGVAVNHSNICNYLTACSPIYKVTRDDRVYQGITIAFDFAIEEIWITFTAGATLIASPGNCQLVGADLAEFLIQEKVTVLGCVPTLLATVDYDVPSLRLLIVGGEVCPQDLVKRWSQPNRRMLNTYGPTETTITATWTELLPEKPVTIGRPLLTYTVYILDEEMRPVLQGETGEIYIGGFGVAQGYLNLPDLTANKFIRDPFEQGYSQARMYRTGDLGRFAPNGEIEYLGRIDQQVKIRGYRIELTEIEAVLIEILEIENAIVSLVSGAIPELAAYVTLRVKVDDPKDLKNRLYKLLRHRLPSYMVPAFIEILDAIPILPNGKADRSSLPKPKTPRFTFHTSHYIAPATDLEKELTKAWSAIFGRDNISVDDDFFNDLGGHSLFAALLISNLRKNPKLQHLSIVDIYSNSTICALANQITTNSSQTKQSDNNSPRDRRRYSNLRVRLCGAVQMVLLYLLFAVIGIPLALVISQTSTWSILTMMLLPASWLLTILVLPIAAKWLLIGRFRPGRYQLWGWYYCRWWLVRKIMALAPLEYLAGSPLMALYLRLLGGRIGKGCHISTANLHLPDLITIGDGASIGYNVEVHPFAIEDGWLYQAPILIGANAFVGTNSVIMLGGSIGQSAQLTEQSLLNRNQIIPEGEIWSGSPSKPNFNPDSTLDEMATRQTLRQNWSLILWVGFAAGFILLEILPLIIASPGWLLIHTFSKNAFQLLITAPLAGLVFVLTTCIVVASGKWLLMPTVQPGIFPLRSNFGLRKWLADNLMTVSLDLTYTLYATLYTLPWLRFLGAKIGSRAEVSTVSHINPDLLTVGSESFVADLATVGSAKYYNGFVAIAPTAIGKRCFVGNSALVPSNTHLGDGSLIGVHSLSPSQDVLPDTSWLGSPAIFLPRRHKCDQFDETLTFRPPTYMVICRLAVEFLRVILPPTLLYLFISPEIQLIIQLGAILPLPVLIALIPAVFLSSALLATVLVAGLKWLVVGRYQPRIAANWSHFIWRTELITGLYESIAVPWFLEWLTGTPILAPLLRLFGAKIGRRVCMETTLLTEFDLVYVGDDVAIADLTSLQTHLFEDRVMKMSKVQISRGCSVGTRSVVLYDSVMEAGSKLDALSLLMKSEVLPSDSEWRGIPARSVVDQ
jgi:non-ribosomal peptide synthetase-like protein